MKYLLLVLLALILSCSKNNPIEPIQDPQVRVIKTLTVEEYHFRAYPYYMQQYDNEYYYEGYSQEPCDSIKYFVNTTHFEVYQKGNIRNYNLNEVIKWQE